MQGSAGSKWAAFGARGLVGRANANPPAFHLTAALALTLALFLIPFSGVVLYPVRLLVTFFHESAHALAAIVTFGSVKSMVVHADTSGLTRTSGGSLIAIATAGYVGTTVLGAALIVASKRTERVKPLLVGLGVATILLAIVFGGGTGTWPALLAAAVGLGLALPTLRRRASTRPAWMRTVGLICLAGAGGFLIYSGAFLTWLIGVGCGAGLVWMGLRASPHVAQFGLAFLAVQTALNALFDIKTLLGISAFSNCHTDAKNMAQHVGMPAIFWASLWGMIALAVVGFAMWRFYRSPQTGAASRG